MSRYIEGKRRTQMVLMPESLDDFVGEDNPVRVIDLFVDELDLQGLGFASAQPAVTGRPGYHPGLPLKLYIYHHLIVAHDVVNVGHDRTQLASMAMQAKAAVDEENVEVLADRGYYKGPEILACEQSGITPFVPMTMTSDNKARGLFDKRDFVYQPDRDAYRCPSGQLLPRHHQSVEQGLVIHTYYNLSACMQCPIKARCTTASKERRVRRWEHEAVLESMQRRLDTSPGKMRQRRSTVEHVFGTLKFWMGATHFLTKTRPRVQTEMCLHVLAYNLRRIISLYGTKGAMNALRWAAV